MARTLEKTKGRKNSHSYFALRHDVIRSNGFRCLSSKAVKLLITFCGQFNGKNNGDMCLTWNMNVNGSYGWKSRSTMHRAICELKETGFIEITRQGGTNKATLYGLTWLSIDDCKNKNGTNKLDVQPTIIPSNLWSQN